MTVADINQIPPAAGLAVPLSRTTVALFRVGAGVHALDDACPRCGASLAAGTIEQSVVVCSTCSWKIDVESGRSIGAPALRVDRYAVKLLGSSILVANEFPARPE